MFRTHYKKFNQYFYDLSHKEDKIYSDPKKTDLIKEYAKQFPGCKTLIETGTYFGSTPIELQNIFENIITIELDPWLYEKASKRLQQYPNILPLHGDSRVMLPKILRIVHSPILYWLDAHYSRGVTGLGSQHTPIIQELSAIRTHDQFMDSIILIDDAVSFTHDKHYPGIGKIEQILVPKPIVIIKEIIVAI